jgi:hypothetical protein
LSPGWVLPCAGLAGSREASCSSRPARWPRRPRRRHGCRRAIRSPVISRRWCSGVPSRLACYWMVDSGGGIDIQVQPLTGTGARAHPRVRAGSPDTGQRAASTSRQIVVDEAPKTRSRSPHRCARRRRCSPLRRRPRGQIREHRTRLVDPWPRWVSANTAVTSADSPVSSATSCSIPTPPCDTPCPYATL